MILDHLTGGAGRTGCFMYVVDLRILYILPKSLVLIHSVTVLD